MNKATKIQKKMYYNHFPIESWDALNMFVRPSERSSGAEDDIGDLVKFNRPSDLRGRRATIH